MTDKFSPINPDFYEMFHSEIEKREHSRVHYFNSEKKLDEARGTIDTIISDTENNEFLKFKDEMKVRLDKIIAVNGKSGPAYNEYDNFANACLDCMGGMED